MKSQIYGWHTSLRVIPTIAQIFHFNLVESWNSLRYLGIPITLKSSYTQI
jgi:hypothetical protein